MVIPSILWLTLCDVFTRYTWYETAVYAYLLFWRIIVKVIRNNSLYLCWHSSKLSIMTFYLFNLNHVGGRQLSLFEESIHFSIIYSVTQRQR